jgi:hypothetical protein
VAPGSLYFVLWRIADFLPRHLFLLQDLHIELILRRNLGTLVVPIFASVLHKPPKGHIAKRGPRIHKSAAARFMVRFIVRGRGGHGSETWQPVEAAIDSLMYRCADEALHPRGLAAIDRRGRHQREISPDSSIGLLIP